MKLKTIIKYSPEILHIGQLDIGTMEPWSPISRTFRDELSGGAICRISRRTDRQTNVRHEENVGYWARKRSCWRQLFRESATASWQPLHVNSTIESGLKLCLPEKSSQHRCDSSTSSKVTHKISVSITSFLHVCYSKQISQVKKTMYKFVFHRSFNLYYSK